MGSLGQELGVPAYALIEASSVPLAQGQGTQYLERNQFNDTVTRITEGTVNDEVVVDVGHGCSVVAVITRFGTAALELEEGGPAVVLFNASSIIIGVSMVCSQRVVVARLVASNNEREPVNAGRCVPAQLLVQP